MIRREGLLIGTNEEIGLRLHVNIHTTLLTIHVQHTQELIGRALAVGIEESPGGRCHHHQEDDAPYDVPGLPALRRHGADLPLPLGSEIKCNEMNFK